MKFNRETDEIEQILESLKAWAEETPAVVALWISGSYALGTADRLSDLNLAGVVGAPAPEVFAALRRLVGDLGEDDLVFERSCEFEGEASRIMVVRRWGTAVDFQFVPPAHLSPAFVGPYPIRVLFTRDCPVQTLHEEARARLGTDRPAEREIRVRQAMRVWNHLRQGIVAWARADHVHAQACLELGRIALAQLLAGRRSVRPASTDQVFVPRYLPETEKALLENSLPRVVVEAQPTALLNLLDALKEASRELEEEHPGGALPRFRRIIEALVSREFPPML